MKNSTSSIGRRTFLTGIGSTALGAGLLRPLIAQAQMGPPKRLLVIHYPCGTSPKNFFPTTAAGSLSTLSPILSVFEKVKGDMVVLDELNNSVIDDWGGDSHARGVISMMTGMKFAQLPGFGVKDGAADSLYIAGADKSIDQVLAGSSPLLKGTLKASIQLGGSRNLTAASGLPGQRCMSYTGPGAPGAIFPEVRPDVALMNIFGMFTPMAPTTMPPPGDSAALMRARAQRKAVLDSVSKDLGRLKAQAPASQRARLDEHLNAIVQLTGQIDAGGAVTPGGGAGPGCAKPTLAPLPAIGNGSSDDPQHEAISRQMMQIIKASFLCDVTRVATFGFANSLSTVNFTRVIQGFTNSTGHHELSHQGASAEPQKVQIEKFYCGIVNELLVDMKNTQESDGTTMLDNTLVVLFTEINEYNEHGSVRMPVVLFGGKSLGLAGGRLVKLGKRFSNDVWTAVAGKFGVPMTAFGDAMFNKGPVSGLFA